MDSQEISQKLGKLFRDRGVSFKENKRSMIFDCPEPSCGKEEKVYLDKTRDGYTSCFSCGSRWHVWDKWVARVMGVSRGEAIKLILGKDSGEHISKALPFTLQQEKVADEPDAVQEKPMPLSSFEFVPAAKSPRAIEYLAQRGVSVDSGILDRYDLRYHSMLDAVVFPIRRAGTVYGWQGRTIPPTDKLEGRLRLVFPPGFNKSRHLLNYDNAKVEQRIILVEGPFDCLHVDLPGSFGGVASFGKLLSHEQIRLLLEASCAEIYIGLDPDAADEVGDLVSALTPAKKVFRIFPPNGKKDFGDCTREEVLDALERAEECVGDPSSRVEVYLNPKRVDPTLNTQRLRPGGSK